MQIDLGHDVRCQLRKALRQAGPREIGGMMFAEQLAPSHFRIMEISLDVRAGSHTTFNRDPQVHSQALDDFFRRTGYDFRRFNYLGEWHSHPSFSVHPSRDDIATMTDLVEGGKDISFAVLLIVRLRYHLWIDCTFTAFARGALPMTSRTVRMLRQ